MTPKEQYAFAKSEHDSIVKGWKTYFGRLPPAVNADGSLEEGGPVGATAGATPETNRNMKHTPQEKREALGIVDNDDTEWDA